MVLRWLDDARTVELSVRDLVGHTSDIPTLVLSAKARARAGIEAHGRASTSADPPVSDPHDADGASTPTRENEARWRHVEEVRGWRCVLNARVDGVVDVLDGHTLIEEVKSVAVAGDELATHPVPRSWIRQVSLYLYIANGMRLPDPCGHLRLVSLLDGAQHVVPLHGESDIGPWLRAWLAARVRARELWLARLPARRATKLDFPHAGMRDGQSEILAACTDVIHRSEVLAIEAPTGLGKTAPVLVGALRAAFVLDRGLFWATARGTQRWIVERTLRDPAFIAADLRFVTVPARAELCPACAEGTCEATAELAELDALDAARSPDADAIRADAKRQACCPWALAVEFASALADVVIADLNYAFEPDIYLRPLFGAGAARQFAVVVDEAHQLPDRARDWASGTLDAGLCDKLDAAYGAPELAAFRAVSAEIRAQLGKAPTLGEPAVSLSIRTLDRLRAIATEMDTMAISHAALRRSAADDPWRALHQAVSRFAAYAEHEGEEVVSFAADSALHLVCRDPSFLLRPRIAAIAGLIASSATLQPTSYWRDRCGVAPEQFHARSIRSPFPPENRLVLIVRSVSTAMKDRTKEHPRIAAMLEQSATEIPGNIAFFFGSFDVMRDFGERLDLSTRTRLMQTPGMSQAERVAMAQAMGTPGKALFAVLGGVFGESIDLPAGALQAAFIVGPSLAPPDIATALVRDYLERKFDDGFGLANIHPGMIRVVQAAGRVVRSPTDRGAIVLVCRRFQQYEYQKYLPTDWNPISTSAPSGQLRAFFANEG